MCLGSSDRSMTQNVGWPKPPSWGEDPPIKIGEDPASPSMQKGKNVNSTNKGKLKSTPPSQSSKNTGLY